MTIARPRIRGDRRGLTLIETLVAVSLLVTMGALAYGGVVMAMKAQSRAANLQERYHTARVALERIKRELSMAFVSLHQADDGRTQTLFDGERDSIIFDTMAHEPVQRNARQSDQVEVEYKLDRVDGQQVLVRRHKFYIDDRPGRGGVEEVVAVGVKDIEFEYFDKAAENWTSEWQVRIDDPVEMRTRLKTVRSLADQVEGQIATATGGSDIAEVLGSMAADKLADQAQGDLLEGLFLPNRVRIRLTLVDEERDHEYLLETQAEIHMVDPLWY